jgi:hypothetical protein
MGKDNADRSPRQSARILELLRAAHGSWVPLPKIPELRIGQYNAGIHELRRAGFPIENKVERDEAGVVHSWYRLIASPTTPLPNPEPELAKPAPEWKKDRQRFTGLPLFDAVVES